jgi:transketolase
MSMGYDEQKTKLAINAIKVLSAEAVEKAGSGHPGMPLGCADTAFILWQYFLRFNPKDPKWPDRDIFILSAGHASMLLYSLLHIYGYDLSIDDIKQFRQFGSKTPGHPELGLTPGVETSTGPLGQGFANGVGIALAKKMLQARLGKNAGIFSSKVYAIVSDGDIMEGISSEAASLAGHLALDNLIYIYDKNDISIEGPTCLAISEDIVAKFRALRWHVISINGHDHSQIMEALNNAQEHKGSPVLIVSSTVIGKDSCSKEGKASCHGEPLGAASLKELKENLNWKYEPFTVPTEVYQLTSQKTGVMEKEYKGWKPRFDKLMNSDPGFKSVINGLFGKELPPELYTELRNGIQYRTEATRVSSGRCIQIIAKHMPAVTGGSADLSPATKTNIINSAYVSAGEYLGNNIHFGVREHAMGSLSNGIAISGAFIPYCSTFMIFSDYMKPSIRMASLMKQQVIYVFAHDSIYVGEDGPTHQPIEQLSTLRMVPEMRVIRPADEAETAEAWLMALEHKSGPTALALTRQNLEPCCKAMAQNYMAEGMRKGAYIAAKETSKLSTVVAASGSEVSLALKVRENLKAEAYMRVVSVPCMELFMEQEEKYRESIIPSDRNIKRIAVEAGVMCLWDKIMGGESLKIGLEHFGTSAPAKDVAKHMKLDVESVTERIKAY